MGRKSRFKQRMEFIISKNRLSRLTHYYLFTPESTQRADTLGNALFYCFS